MRTEFYALVGVFETEPGPPARPVKLTMAHPRLLGVHVDLETATTAYRQLSLMADVEVALVGLSLLAGPQALLRQRLRPADPAPLIDVARPEVQDVLLAAWGKFVDARRHNLPLGLTDHGRECVQAIKDAQKARAEARS